jgi:two-component system chemotaxis response regulator CheY
MAISSDGGNMRILVVEDDFGSRRMMQKLLAPYGDVDVVVDGEESVEAFRLAWEEAKPYELVFMDIMMPRMDGQEALKRLRAYEREVGVKPSDEAKVIMTSVLEDPKNVIEAYYDGAATSYLVKPLDRVKIASELARLGFPAAS